MNETIPSVEPIIPRVKQISNVSIVKETDTRVGVCGLEPATPGGSEEVHGVYTTARRSA